jgi:predicted dehydrogenase
MDQDHVGYAIAALKKGYDLLLEKPISPSLKECLETRRRISKTPAKRGCLPRAPLQHLLWQDQRRCIKEGKLGEIVNVEASENVGYWHMAHSFVRGNWGNSENSSAR